MISIIRFAALVRWIAVRMGLRPPLPAPTSPPALHPLALPSAGQTSLALGTGYIVLTVGFMVSLLVRDLTVPDDAVARTQAFLMGVWGMWSLLAFGPGVYVARRWWRKRRPEDRRATPAPPHWPPSGSGRPSWREF